MYQANTGSLPRVSTKSVPCPSLGTAAPGHTLVLVRALLVFALTLAVFGLRHLPGVSDETADWINLATPFAVVAAAAGVLVPLGARGVRLGVAIAGGILYVNGHGMHLAANAIRAEGLEGEAERVAYFWDEDLSHWELHAGLLLLVVAFCLAEAAAPAPVAWSPVTAAAAVAVLGATLFASVVEGGTWWFLGPAAVLVAAWAFVRPRPLLAACAAAFVLAALLLAGWAAWHGGVPEFSELEWI